MKLIILSLTYFLILSSSIAQSTDERAIEANINAFSKARIDVDLSVLDKLTAKELSYGHSTGTIENKTEFLEIVKSRKSVYKRIDLTNQTINIVDNIAIVRHVFNAELESNGTMQTSKLGILQIWKKQQDTWQMIARQAYKL